MAGFSLRRQTFDVLLAANGMAQTELVEALVMLAGLVPDPQWLLLAVLQ